MVAAYTGWTVRPTVLLSPVDDQKVGEKAMG